MKLKKKIYLFIFLLIFTLMPASSIVTVNASSDINTQSNQSKNNYNDDIAQMKTIINKYAVEWKRDSETGKYLYPVTPESEIWVTLNHAEKVALCNIPDYVINTITDQELIDLVLDYPLLIDVYAYSSFEEGVKKVAEYFPALEKAVNNKLINSSSLSIVSNKCNNIIPSYFKRDFMNSYYKNEIKTIDNKSKDSVIYTGVYTPRNTYVPCIMAGEFLSPTTKDEIKKEIKAAYPNCNYISEATTNYNCHSYAWHKMSTSNKLWMEDPSAYMTDGSYTYVGNIPTTNYQRVYYDYKDNEHSGVVIDYSTLEIQSKWGQLPLMSHNVYDCPYFHIPLDKNCIKYYEENKLY